MNMGGETAALWRQRIWGAGRQLFDVEESLAGIWLLLKWSDIQLKIYGPGQPCDLDTLEDEILKGAV